MTNIVAMRIDQDDIYGGVPEKGLSGRQICDRATCTKFMQSDLDRHDVRRSRLGFVSVSP